MTGDGIGLERGREWGRRKTERGEGARVPSKVCRGESKEGVLDFFLPCQSSETFHEKKNL